MEDSLQLTNSRNFKFYMTYIKKRFFFFFYRLILFLCLLFLSTDLEIFKH